MPPRPTRRTRVPRYPVSSSVRSITNLAQWTRLHKRAKNKLIFVMYTLEFVRNSHRLKTTLVELSAHSEFQDVLFAVVDIEKAKEVAEQENISIQDAPTFICYQSGAVVEKLERVNGDSAPSSLWQMLHRNAVRVRAEMARNLPNSKSNMHWHVVGQAVAFLAFSIGAVLALAFLKTVPPPEVNERDIRLSSPRRERNESNKKKVAST